MANLGADSLSVSLPSDSNVIYASDELSADALAQGMLPPWSVVWFLR